MTQTETLLRHLGIHATYLGSYYLNYAIDLTLSDDTYLLNLTKRLYPAIAEKFEVSPACVERNIRTAVNVCWMYGNRDLLNKIAGYELNSRPANGEFISILTGYIKANRENE